MEPSFWHDRWETNRIGFHMSDAHPLLVEHFKELSLPEGARVLIPLCGKTRDIAWLLSQGYRVAGAELSQTAITQLFEELEVEPTIEPIGELLHYSAPNIDIFVGDLFNLSADVLGDVDAIYDRAALVALPYEMRRQYAAQLVGITGNKPQLIISFEYDQSAMQGPPFSISIDEVTQLYGAHYAHELLLQRPLAGGLRDNIEATPTGLDTSGQGLSALYLEKYVEKRHQMTCFDRVNRL